MSNGTVRCWSREQRAHWEADLGVPIVSLHEGGYDSRADEVVCALHASDPRDVLEAVYTAGNGHVHQRRRLHDVVYKVKWYSSYWHLQLAGPSLTEGSTNAGKERRRGLLKPAASPERRVAGVRHRSIFGGLLCTGPERPRRVRARGFRRTRAGATGRVPPWTRKCSAGATLESVVSTRAERSRSVSYAQVLADGGTVLDLRNLDTDGDGQGPLGRRRR